MHRDGELPVISRHSPAACPLLHSGGGTGLPLPCAVLGERIIMDNQDARKNVPVVIWMSAPLGVCAKSNIVSGMSVESLAEPVSGR